MFLLEFTALFCLVIFSQAEGSHRTPLSLHVLNVLTGHPGIGVEVQCFRLGYSKNEWIELMTSYTDNDGRLNVVSPELQRLHPGIYKVRFETAAYWRQQGLTTFYPYVEVVFTVTKNEKRVHVPLLLSPYSYTTYRGS